MPKKKKSSPKRKKKQITSTKFQTFLLGIFVGIGLFWVQQDHDVFPVQLSQATWSAEQVESAFARQLPVSAPLLKREGHITSYDGRTRNAHWVYHKLNSDIVEKKISRKEYSFKEDPLLPRHVRATKKDYQKSGFDRGHLCAASDSYSPSTMEDTFFLSNIAPQSPAFNRGYWKKVENHARSLTKKYRNVHVFTGPLYLSNKKRDGKRYVTYEVIGDSQVAVPTHFFALLFVEATNGKMLSKAYILPNQSIESHIPLKKFTASLEEIETASGVLFTEILQNPS